MCFKGREFKDAKQLAELIRKIMMGNFPFALIYVDEDEHVHTMASDPAWLPTFSEHMQRVHADGNWGEDSGERSN